MRYLPEMKDCSLICVKKIDSVRYVDELKVLSSKTFTDEENSYFEKQVKAFLYTSFPLGAPFTVNVGCKICLPSLHNNDTTFTVQSYKLTQPSYDDGGTGYECTDQGHDLTNEKSNTFPSELITIDECEGSVSSVTEKVSKLHISTPVPPHRIQLDETVNMTNFEADIWTSTPKRVSSEGSGHNLTFNSKIDSKDISAISGNVTQNRSYSRFDKVTPWVRTGSNTKIIIQARSVGKIDDVHLNKTSAQDEYFKDHTYYNLKKIMEVALKGSAITGEELLFIYSLTNKKNPVIRVRNINTSKQNSFIYILFEQLN